MFYFAGVEGYTGLMGPKGYEGIPGSQVNQIKNAFIKPV